MILIRAEKEGSYISSRNRRFVLIIPQVLYCVEDVKEGRGKQPEQKKGGNARKCFGV